MRYEARLQALIARLEASRTRVIAMRTMNESRSGHGYAQAYAEQSFREESESQDAIAQEMLELASLMDGHGLGS